MTNETNKPQDTIRDGRLKAVIWGNPLQDGEGLRYSVDFILSYQDGNGDWQDTRSFGNAELLRIQRLAGKAYDRIGELRQEARDET